MDMPKTARVWISRLVEAEKLGSALQAIEANGYVIRDIFLEHTFVEDEERAWAAYYRVIAYRDVPL